MFYLSIACSNFPSDGYTRSASESINNQTSVNDNEILMEFEAVPAHKICTEGGSFRCVVDGSSMLTICLPARI